METLELRDEIEHLGVMMLDAGSNVLYSAPLVKGVLCAARGISYPTLTESPGRLHFSPMAQDYSELVEYLDKKFTGIDERFDSVETRFETIDERIGGLVHGLRSVDDRLGSVEQDLRDLHADFVKLQDGVDAYAKKADTYFQEMLMLANKVDRHEKWLRQLAEKMGVKLEY